MSSNDLIRIFFSFIFSIALIYGIYTQDENERKSLNENEKRQRYVPLIPSNLYLMFLLEIFIIASVVVGIKSSIKQIFMACFSIFLHISFYYSVLLVLMPWIRKKISARVCAALWMIPNMLYLFHLSFMKLNRPAFLFYTSIKNIDFVVKAWIIGFLVVLVWKLLEHFLFCASILKNAYPVEDNEVLKIWKSELALAKMNKKKLRLVISPYVKTPLTIGFWHKTIKIVLPEKEYTPNQYHLILRHEIVHIGREDASSKLFMIFCAAVCWFNPLMWIAIKESAKDMELSCDETVLLEADDETKEKYAQLVLKTAGDDRGFSTCLSSDAKSLRYRLKNIIQPRKYSLGAILAGAVTFLLFISCGNMALAYSAGSVNELVFNADDISKYHVDFINKEDISHLDYYQCLDEEQLLTYLADLELYEITGNYSYSTYDHLMLICLNHSDGDFVLSLTDDTLKITPLHKENLSSKTYLLKEKIDWDKIDCLIVQEKKEENYPYPPEMVMYFNEEINPNGSLMNAYGRILSKQIGTENIEIEINEDEAATLISGYDVQEVRLSFSHELYTGEYLVEIRKWNDDEIMHISSLDFEEENVLKLKTYDAHYRVYGLFSEDGSVVYEMEYLFDVQLPK